MRMMRRVVVIGTILLLVSQFVQCDPKQDKSKRLLIHNNQPCKGLPSTQHGTFICAHPHPNNQKCGLKCDDGYAKSGQPKHAVCNNGQWQVKVSCKVIECSKPATVINGMYDCPLNTFYSVGAECHLTCSAGYKPSITEAKIKCMTSGKWDNSPTCEEVHCPTPRHPPHGTYTCPGHLVVGSTCSLTCTDLYEPSHQAISCTSTETWTQSACIVKKCQDPPTVINGHYDCPNTDHVVNSLCSLQCEQGYRISSTPSSIRCLATKTWTSHTHCVEVRCPNPPPVTHGEYLCDSTPYKEGVKCSLNCHAGYKSAHGHAGIWCLSNDKWSAPTRCAEIICPAPPKISNGSYTCPKTTHKWRDVCHLNCDYGFKPNPSKVSHIQCLGSDKWSTPSDCQEIKCPVAPKVNHGYYSCKHHTLDSACHLHCEPGYSKSRDDPNIKCLSSDQWSAPATCQEIICPDPSPITGGHFTCDNSTHKLNDVCNLHCDHGYRVYKNRSTITCTSRSLWSHAACVEIRCPTPPTVSHGLYTCPNTSHHTLDQFCPLHCDTGYKPHQHSHHPGIKCLANSQWSGVGGCVEIQCPAPPAVTYGNYTCPRSPGKYGDECHLNCLHGYKPSTSVSKSHIRCQHSDSWSPPATCQEIKCPVPADIANGRYHCSKHLGLDAVCYLRCNLGFRPTLNVSRSEIRCLSTDKWTHPDKCVEVRCPDPPKVNHGIYRCNNTVHGLQDVCSLYCEHGHKPTKDHGTDVYCRYTQEWSRPFDCRRITCHAPQKVRNGVYRCTTSQYLDDVCHLQCMIGFEPNTTDSDIHCRYEETWTPAASCKRIICPAPPKVSHGQYYCGRLVNHLNDACHLTCQSGYKPSLSSDITCLAGDRWTRQGTCIEIKCPAPPKIANGVYQCAKATHRLHDICHLKCTEGYRPTAVHTDIRCLSTDKWSGHTNCLEILCTPPTIINGGYNCPHNRSKLNDVCHLQCRAGYKPSSMISDIRCQYEGKFSTGATCEEIRCPKPPNIANGDYICAHKSYYKLGERCQLRCHSGYKSSLPISDIHCQSTDTWSTSAKCVEIQCPVPTKVAGGHYHCTGAPPYKLNAKCMLQCNHGYKPLGGTQISCLSTDSWSKLSHCVEIKCPLPSNVAYGHYTCQHGPPYTLDESCSLKCEDGYKPSSSPSTIHCLQSDTWSALVSCLQIRCAPPPLVLNGAYWCDNNSTHHLNDTCHLLCNHGYRPNIIDPDIHCLPSDNWSPATHCEEITCPMPPVVSNGQYTCDSSHHSMETKCHLTCHHGYKPSSSTASTIQCLSNQAWSQHAVCIEIICPDLPIVTGGSYRCNSTKYKLDVDCQLQCHVGFKPRSTHSDIRCLSTNRWSYATPCVEIKCASPPTVAHGRFHCSTGHASTFRLHDTCSLQCDEGYKPSSPSSSIQCQTTDQWSHSATCVEINCPMPISIPHGEYHCNSNPPYEWKSSCQLHCFHGYKARSPQSYIHCLGNETWSSSDNCVQIICPTPKPVTNGEYHCASNSSSHRLDDVCHLQCDSGFKPATINSDIHCLTSDTWSADSACKEIVCPHPPNILHGEYHCPNMTNKLNDVCTLQCDSGFKPHVKSSQIQCLYTDMWSPPSTCVQIQCPVSPPTVEHGSYICDNTSPHGAGLDDKCQLHCNHGYKPKLTSSDIHCQQSETWSMESSCVEIQCSAPPTVSNGSYVCDKTGTHHLDDECHLTCNEGHKPSSTITSISCLSNDTWSTPDTNCIDVECRSPPVVENGVYHCWPLTGPYRVSDMCGLQCNNGFRTSSTNSTISCSNSGHWTQPVTCVEILCPDPPVLQHGRYVCNNDSIHRLNDECNLSCDDLYKPYTTPSNIQCLPDDTWSTSSHCVEKSCDTPPLLDHGSYSCNSTTLRVATSCDLQCDPGYTLGPGNGYTYCQNDERWSIASSCVAS